MVLMRDSHITSVMYCPVCGKQCQVIVDTFCYLCVDCDNQWFYSNGVYCSKSNLEDSRNDETGIEIWLQILPGK